MTLFAPSTLKVGPNQFEDGQAAGSITPGRMRDAIDSTAGLFAPTAQTGSYTLVLTDGGCCIEMNAAGANNLTVPPNSSVAFLVGTVVEVYQMGAGQTTIVAGGGVTLRSATGTLTLRAQFSVASIRKRATDEWVVSGDMS